MIHAVADAEIETAVSLLLAPLAAPWREDQVRTTVAGLRSALLDRAGLHVATRGERIVGTAWSQLLPGRIATLWPPALVPDEPEATAERLLASVEQSAFDRGAVLLQALLPEELAQGGARLVAAGYERGGELFVALAQPESFPDAPPGPLEFVNYEPSDHARLSALIESTYVGSLDLPVLDGARAMDDVLAGYEATGTSRRSLWWFARHDGADVGCLLLAQYEDGTCELVYMGLTPPARGRGWGRVLARQAQWIARTRSAPAVLLVVDVGNGPARAIYRACGFQEWQSRALYLKRLAPNV